MNKYWETAWAAQKVEQLSKTGVDQEKWKASGRATKANPDKENGAWWNVNGSEMVDSWIAWRNAEHPLVIWESPIGHPAIELSITPVWNDIPVQMHIDRVMVNSDGELIVLDIKTGARTPSSDLQLAFYAAGMEDVLSIRPRYGAYWMARTGQTSELIDLDYLSKDVIIEMVTKFDQARKAELFIPNFNHCIMCNVKDKCKYKRKG